MSSVAVIKSSSLKDILAGIGRRLSLRSDGYSADPYRQILFWMGQGGEHYCNVLGDLLFNTIHTKKMVLTLLSLQQFLSENDSPSTGTVTSSDEERWKLQASDETIPYELINELYDKAQAFYAIDSRVVGLCVGATGRPEWLSSTQNYLNRLDVAESAHLFKRSELVKFLELTEDENQALEGRYDSAQKQFSDALAMQRAAMRIQQARQKHASDLTLVDYLESIKHVDKTAQGSSFDFNELLQDETLQEVLEHLLSQGRSIIKTIKTLLSLKELLTSLPSGEIKGEIYLKDNQWFHYWTNEATPNAQLVDGFYGAYLSRYSEWKDSTTAIFVRARHFKPFEKLAELIDDLDKTKPLSLAQPFRFYDLVELNLCDLNLCDLNL